MSGGTWLESGEVRPAYAQPAPRLIHEVDPEIIEEWKWRGVPTGYHDGIVCTGETNKALLREAVALNESKTKR